MFKKYIKMFVMHTLNLCVKVLGIRKKDVYFSSTIWIVYIFTGASNQGWSFGHKFSSKNPKTIPQILNFYGHSSLKFSGFFYDSFSLTKEVIRINESLILSCTNTINVRFGITAVHCLYNSGFYWSGQCFFQNIW